MRKLLNILIAAAFAIVIFGGLSACNDQTRPSVAEVASTATQTAEWGISTAMVLPDLVRLGNEWGQVEAAVATPEGDYTQAEINQIDADVDQIAMLVANTTGVIGAGDDPMVWINRAAALGYVDASLAAWQSLRGIVGGHLAEMSAERRALVSGWIALGDRLAGNLERMRDVPGGEAVSGYVRDAIALARTAAEIAAAVGAVKSVL